MSFQIGDQIGDYSIVAAVGSGGAGQVFKVEHRITGRVEAMKVLLQGRVQSASPGERFQREIKLQASLNHPNIASVHNAFWVRDELVMVMELIEGSSLDKIIAERPLRPSQALHIGRQALRALEYAHQRGITHRDIKPENIMVDSRGVAKLMDFGLAKDIHDARLTQTGAVVGSLFYISPEQAQGLDDVDHRSDIYSLGAVLYELVTGAKPFPLNSSFALLQAAVQEDPKPPAELKPDIPSALNDAILKAMAKTPAERFQTALEFGKALESIARDPSSSSAQIQLPTPASAPPAVRRRKVRLRAAALAIGSVTLGVVGLRSLSETPLADEVRSYQRQADFLAEAATVFSPGTLGRVRTVSFGEPLRLIAFSNDGERIAAVLGENRVEVVGFNGGENIAFQPGEAPIQLLALSPRGRLLVTADAGSDARLWNLEDQRELRRLSHAGPVTAVAFSADGRWLASGSADGTVRAWNLEDPTESHSLPGPPHGPRALRFSPSGALLAVPGEGRLQLWATSGNGDGESLGGSRGGYDRLVFSASGLELASLRGAVVDVWDMPGRRLKWSQQLDSNVAGLAKGPTSPWLAVSISKEEPDSADMWDVRTGRRLVALESEGSLDHVALSADGTRVATATSNGDLALWRSVD